jgi:hypothetical protein
MNCPKCSTYNDQNNAFCVNCGEVFRSDSSTPSTALPNFSDAPPPTQVYPIQPSDEYLSSPTIVSRPNQSQNQPQANFNQQQANYNQPPPVFDQSMSGFNQPFQYAAPSPAPPKSRGGLWLGLGFLAFLLLGGCVIGGIVLLRNIGDKNGNTNKDENVAVNTNSDNSNQTNANKPANTEKNKATPTPKPTVTPPPNAKTGYATTNNIVMRSEPGLEASKVGSLKNGQKVYVLSYSDRKDYWNGMEGNWLNVQTETGQRGWVFAPLIKY